MEHFGSFVTLAAIPYLVGFLALCFWWRWWLLVPAGLVATVLAKIEYASVNASDGAGAAFGIILVVFAMIGGASGFIASVVVVIGRMARLRALRAVYVLPVVFILGFGSYFAVTWTPAENQGGSLCAARCRMSRQPASGPDCRFAIAISVAPGIFLYCDGTSDGHYIL
ncbi:hypothetical protein [Rhizobium leguminosarum]|uniref:hypothetical protein n=1 Tax=Rhizobium leguminosarum TaxID=384 RepID=UPI001FE1E67F|nr:hypothetical protein [Rhizobium leguminosarum]